MSIVMVGIVDLMGICTCLIVDLMGMYNIERRKGDKVCHDLSQGQTSSYSNRCMFASCDASNKE